MALRPVECLADSLSRESAWLSGYRGLLGSCLAAMENAILKIKEQLHGIAARTYEALVDAVKQAVAEVSPGNAQGWFKGCGYTIVGPDNDP